MNSGFSIFEIMIVMAISLSILSIVIINLSQASSVSKRIISNQQKLEMIFHTVDTIKSDLTKCGMRLQEARKHFDLQLFEHAGKHFRLIYGLSGETLNADSHHGEKTIDIHKNEYFKTGKKVIIYHCETHVYEYNQIGHQENGKLILTTPLQHDYPANSYAIILKQVEYQLYEKESILKRKVDKGYFQPLIEDVTDFYLTYFPESQSVLYKIEVNRKEQIRGYIFLVNMVS